MEIKVTKKWAVLVRNQCKVVKNSPAISGVRSQPLYYFLVKFSGAMFKNIKINKKYDRYLNKVKNKKFWTREKKRDPTSGISFFIFSGAIAKKQVNKAIKIFGSSLWACWFFGKKNWVIMRSPEVLQRIINYQWIVNAGYTWTILHRSSTQYSDIQISVASNELHYNINFLHHFLLLFLYFQILYSYTRRK